MTLTVDVTSDVICPWCYVGKRRWEPDQLDIGRRLQIHGQRIGNRSQLNKQAT